KVPLPPEQQVTLEVPELDNLQYRGPGHRVIGFMVRDVTSAEYVETAGYLAQVARRLLDSGQALFDRTAPDHLHARADAEIAALKAAHQQAETARREREEIRKRVGQALGAYDPETDRFTSEPQWTKESR